MPASKVTRVRSDGFSKYMNSVLPASASAKCGGLALTSAATSRMRSQLLGREIEQGDQVPSGQAFAAHFCLLTPREERGFRAW